MGHHALGIFGRLAAISLLLAFGSGCGQHDGESTAGVAETGAGGGGGSDDHLFTQEVRLSNLPDVCTSKHTRALSPGTGEAFSTTRRTTSAANAGA